MRFGSLHNHTDYSNVKGMRDSTVKVHQLIDKAIELDYCGVAITDHAVISSHIKALQHLDKVGKDKIKLGLGNEIYVTENLEDNKFYHLVVVAKDYTGYKQLRKITNQMWRNRYTFKGHERAVLTFDELWDIVKDNKGHLIVTSACLGSYLGKYVSEFALETDETRIKELKVAIHKFMTYSKALFEDDFYIEIQPSAQEDQILYNKKILELAKIYNIEIVIATDTHYLVKEDKEVHKAFLNADKEEGDERETDSFYDSTYMHTIEEMRKKLDYISEEDFDRAIKNTEDIFINKIEQFDLFKEQDIPKVDVVPRNINTDEIKEYEYLKELYETNSKQNKYLVSEAIISLKEKGRFNYVYLERLDEEADTILHLSKRLGQDLSAYFNTLQSYIDLFWECESVVGCGRGSSVGYLFCYLLGITQLDPVAWELPHFRFLNKERVEIPDIDTDLSPAKKPVILERIRERLGHREELLAISTFGTEGSRSTVLTACRGLGIDNTIAQYIASMIPQERMQLYTLTECFYGDEENGRKPVADFVNEVAKYPKLKETMLKIEGLVCNRSIHPAGVIFTDSAVDDLISFFTNDKNELVAQFDLGDTEFQGGLKYDFLVTSMIQKVGVCLQLLQEDGILDKNKTLRELYNEILHPEVINLKDPRIWKALQENSVLDIFQFNSQEGVKAVKQIKPNNILQMTSANALMRLQGSEGMERPIDRYTRLKDNVDLWLQECNEWGLTEEEINVLRPHYEKRGFTLAFQEDLMIILMDEKISNFTLGESNKARKTVAKKLSRDVDALYDLYIRKGTEVGTRKVLLDYVWETCIKLQLNYAFSILHSLAYSFIGIQGIILGIDYPEHWNTAILTVESGCDIEDGTTDYGKMATAISTLTAHGIKVYAPNINSSKIGFSVNDNKILYGLKAISSINSEVVDTIISNRPYYSLKDFIEKTSLDNTKMINLIKSGAFNEFGDRFELMKQYIEMIYEKKNNLTTSNIAKLIELDLVPEELKLEVRLFKFRKYVFDKKYFERNDDKTKSKKYYKLEPRFALPFFVEHFIDLLEEDKDYTYNNCGEIIVLDKNFDKIYKKKMVKLLDWLSKEETLSMMNEAMFTECWNKYVKTEFKDCTPRWEMTSLGFYASEEHELHSVNLDMYNIVEFNKLSEAPIITGENIRGERVFKQYETSTVAGVVLATNNNRHIVTILTPFGEVVNVKYSKGQYSHYNKTISKYNEATEKNERIEESFFKRYNIIFVKGYRDGDLFRARTFDFTHTTANIKEIRENGMVWLQDERAKIE